MLMKCMSCSLLFFILICTLSYAKDYDNQNAQTTSSRGSFNSFNNQNVFDAQNNNKQETKNNNGNNGNVNIRNQQPSDDEILIKNRVKTKGTDFIYKSFMKTEVYQHNDFLADCKSLLTERDNSLNTMDEMILLHNYYKGGNVKDGLEYYFKSPKIYHIGMTEKEIKTLNSYKERFEYMQRLLKGKNCDFKFIDFNQ